MSEDEGPGAPARPPSEKAKSTPKPKAKKVRLDVLLTERGLEESRTRAQARILAGEVVVDDHRVDKPGTKVAADAVVRLKGEGLKWVSRGGTKLSGALASFPGPVAGAVCLDVGASTGGFTHVLLEAGAARVYAVDVGYGQLAWRLRQDERVVCMERTHIAKVAPADLDPRPRVGVVDVSFISLVRVLPAMSALLTDACHVWALVKPQFEVGPGDVGKGGIVRDPVARQRALDSVLAVARGLGFEVRGTRESPIQGADGNVEFLAALVRGAPAPASAAGADEAG